MSIGVGLMLGPVLATIVSQFLDYAFTLFFFAGVIGCVGIPLAISLPGRLNVKKSDSDEEEENPIPWTDFLKDARALMVSLVSMIAGASFMVFEPILTPRLVAIGMN